MLEILEYFISVLTTDATLNAIVPVANIFTGAVDVTTEQQNGLLLPQINVHIVSEASRTVPLNTRDTVVQIDIWDRNNYLETITISERILTLLNYKTIDKNTAHIFWERLGSTVDQYESDRRIWHRSLTFTVWDILGQ